MFENLLENFNTNTSQYYSSSQKSNDMSNLDENGYNISSMKNIDSSLEKELRLLHALYKRTLKNVLNVNLDFNNLSKEEICVINSCEATLYQYYDGYELKLALYMNNDELDEHVNNPHLISLRGFEEGACRKSIRTFLLW